MTMLRTASVVLWKDLRIEMRTRDAIGAADLLEADFGVPADVFSVTSFSELRREALDAERWNMLHPGEAPRTPYVKELLAGQSGPFVAATDYMRAVPDQIREWVPGRYHVLGTDGYGRSDSRAALRDFFEVDRRWVTVAALKALADEGRLDVATVTDAIQRFGIDPDKPNPVMV